MTFTESVAHYTKGLEFFSVGTCPGCVDCGLTLWSPARGYHETEHEPAEEFSWSMCESCGSMLGGSRHPAHSFVTIDGKRVLCHLLVCVDCLMYHANGELPDDEPEPEPANAFDLAIELLRGEPE